MRCAFQRLRTVAAASAMYSILLKTHHTKKLRLATVLLSLVFGGTVLAYLLLKRASHDSEFMVRLFFLLCRLFSCRF